MIKLILNIFLILFVLALIGDSVQFQFTDESWSLIINHKAAMNGILNGFSTVYDFIKELLIGAD